jgi:hypothetical protein
MSSTNPSSTTNPSSSNNNNNGPAATEASSSSEFQEVDTSKIQTVEEAMDTLNRLKVMKDSLLEEKKRNDSYMKRYTDKVAKCERMATLHNLIPRQLFVREDAYQRELEKVEKWSGISDQEIADIYRRKLNELNNNSKFKHHGASVIHPTSMKDPYAGFRDVPDFSKVNGKSPNSNSFNNTNNVLRNLDMMRRISSLHSSS